jgi:Leucine-rich repeat (LRR) protein
MQRFIVFMVLMLCLVGAGCRQSATSLDLSKQGLTQVSQDVFEQTQLVELNLSDNRLTGAIPAEIRLLSKLEVLDMSDNAMTGLPAEIGQLSHLKTLDVSNNQLTGLPLELGQLKNLETLDLRGNNYSKQDLDRIRINLLQTNILVD